MKTQGTLVARRKTEGQPHQTHGEVGGLRGAGPGRPGRCDRAPGARRSMRFYLPVRSIRQLSDFNVQTPLGTEDGHAIGTGGHDGLSSPITGRPNCG